MPDLLDLILTHCLGDSPIRLRIRADIWHRSGIWIDARRDLSKDKQLIWWAAQNGIICIKQGHDFIFQKQPAPLSVVPPPAVFSAAAGTPPCSPETIPVAASPVCSPDASPPISSPSPSTDASRADIPDDTPARLLDF